MDYSSAVNSQLDMITSLSNSIERDSFTADKLGATQNLISKKIYVTYAME